MHDKNLDVLQFCQSDYDDLPRRTDIPSWTPDWCSRDRSTFIHESYRDRPPFRATGDHTIGLEFKLENVFENPILRVRCLVADRLAVDSAYISGRTPYSFDPLEDVENLFELWRKIAERDYGNMESVPYTSGSFHQIDAFWKVLLQGFRRDDKDINKIRMRLWQTCYQGRFFRSPKGYMGVTKGVQDLRHTDLICVIFGAKLPFFLRKVDDHYILIRDAYVEGLMYGEAIKMMEEGTLELQTIEIH